HREAHSIYGRYPDPDDQELRDAALSAAVQWMLGETTLERAREQLVSARIAAARASAAAQQVAVMAHADGMPESHADAAVGIDRMVLREPLGKRCREKRPRRERTAQPPGAVATPHPAPTRVSLRRQLLVRRRQVGADRRTHGDDQTDQFRLQLDTEQPRHPDHRATCYGTQQATD